MNKLSPLEIAKKKPAEVGGLECFVGRNMGLYEFFRKGSNKELVGFGKRN